MLSKRATHKNNPNKCSRREPLSITPHDSVGQKAISTGQRPVGIRALEERPERAKPYTNKCSRREQLSIAMAAVVYLATLWSKLVEATPHDSVGYKSNQDKGSRREPLSITPHDSVGYKSDQDKGSRREPLSNV